MVRRQKGTVREAENDDRDCARAEIGLDGVFGRAKGHEPTVDEAAVVEAGGPRRRACSDHPSPRLGAPLDEVIQHEPEVQPEPS